MRRIALLTTLFISMIMLQSFRPPWSSPTLAAQGSPNSQVDAFPSIKKLSVREIDKLLDTSPRVVILDVRKPDEAGQAGTFKGAINIPVDQLEQRLNEISKDRPVLPFSNHAARASRAADLLEKHGYKIAGAAGVQSYAADGGTKYLIPPVSASK